MTSKLVPAARTAWALYIAPASKQTAPTGNGQDVETATPTQCQDIRICLTMTGNSETEIAQFYRVPRLEELPSVGAHKVVSGLMERRRAPAN